MELRTGQRISDCPQNQSSSATKLHVHLRSTGRHTPPSHCITADCRWSAPPAKSPRFRSCGRRSDKITTVVLGLVATPAGEDQVGWIVAAAAGLGLRPCMRPGVGRGTASSACNSPYSAGFPRRPMGSSEPETALRSARSVRGQQLVSRGITQENGTCCKITGKFLPPATFHAFRSERRRSPDHLKGNIPSDCSFISIESSHRHVDLHALRQTSSR